jgi:hypothetical protein
VNDLRYIERACAAERLPPENREYIGRILLNVRRLPKPREIANAINFTNEQRERHRLWSIPPVDMSKSQLKAQRQKKDKERKALARRRRALRIHGHYQDRKTYLAQFANSIQKTQPWKAFDPPMSRAKWYRLGKPTPPTEVRHTEVRQGSSAHIYTKGGHTLSHASQIQPQWGYQGGAVSRSRVYLASESVLVDR